MQKTGHGYCHNCMCVDGRWTFQLWADAKPVSGKIYRLRVSVPDELIGDDFDASTKSVTPGQ